MTRVRKRPGVVLVHSTVEDQLHLTGPADVQVFADYLLEEHSACYGPLQNLGQGELRLENRDLVAIAGLAILGLIRMRQ